MGGVVCVILTRCRCVCVERWCEGWWSAAPQGGSSSRRTDLVDATGKKKKKNHTYMNPNHAFILKGTSPPGDDSRLLTSRLSDAGVSGGLHRHSCSIADGGGGKISESCFSAHRLAARTAAITERVLDHSLTEVMMTSLMCFHGEEWMDCAPPSSGQSHTSSMNQVKNKHGAFNDLTCATAWGAPVNAAVETTLTAPVPSAVASKSSVTWTTR